jgi:hypothetical protein
VIDLPTTRADWSNRGPAIRRTLADPGPLAVAVVVGLFVALSASASRDLQFVLDVLESEGLSVGFKSEFLLLHLPGLGTTAGPVDALVAVGVAAIAGVTAAMLARAILTGTESTDHPADRDAGLVFGTLGIALAALGPAVIAGIAGLAGADGALAGLPLGGLEGSMLAVPMLVLSTYWLAAGLDGDGEESPIHGDR